MSSNTFDENTGAICGTYTNNASCSRDAGVPQPASGRLAQTNQG
ncbi:MULTISPECIES: hypothetical protein [unclassified Bradyrhizobium]|nr:MULTISPECIES: hypothetical protein [unclassified Bradyrhizobium]